MKVREVATVASYMLPVSCWVPGRDNPEGAFTYIDLSAVDNDAKLITAARSIRGKEAPSRARQIVKAGDVLVSTVRPNLNGVALVPDELDGATASTGFCVLRPVQGRLNSRYLFHWVRSSRFISDMVKKATGASYPAVSDRIIYDSILPVASQVEQRRIAEILDKADALRAKRRAALAQLDSLAQSIFLDMFGDPVANTKQWPLMKLGELGALDRGVSKHRPRNDPSLLGGPYPLVQTGDVSNCGGYLTAYEQTYSEQGLAQSKLWPAGTLCITIAANIAKTGILTFDACFPDSVVGFTSGEPAVVEFVRIWLSFLQKALEDAAPESAQKNINLAMLRGLDVPAPPISMLKEFHQRVRQVRALKAMQLKSLEACEELFLSLQQRLFAGELAHAG